MLHRGNRAVGAPAVAQGPFLVGLDDDYGDVRITVHTARKSMSRDQIRRLKSEFRQEGFHSRLRIRRYKSIGLDQAGSLEAFLERFAHDQILYDSTGAMRQLRQLPEFVKLTRQRMAKSGVCFLWDAATGTIFVTLPPESGFGSSDARKTHLANVSAIIRESLQATMGRNAGDFVKAIKIGFNRPAGVLTPIDRLSAAHRQQQPAHRVH